jgi:hypothetical protein
MSISPISRSIPTPGPSGTASAPAVAGAHWFSDQLIEEQNWSDLERLTPSDKALIKQVTGQDIPTRASGNPPVAPILAFQISGDRKDGVIPAGQPVSAAYIKGLIDRYAGMTTPSATNWTRR